LLTLMVRGIPSWYKQQQLLQQLESSGAFASYDFFYLPRDMRDRKNRGFFFVNFCNAAGSEAFYKAFHGKLLAEDAEKELVVAPANMQGYDAIAAHFATTDRRGQPESSGPLFLRDAGSHRASTDSLAEASKGHAQKCDVQAPDAPSLSSGSEAEESTTACSTSSTSSTSLTSSTSSKHQHVQHSIDIAVQGALQFLTPVYERRLKHELNIQVCRSMESFHEEERRLLAQLRLARMKADEHRQLAEKFQQRLLVQQWENHQLRQVLQQQAVQQQRRQQHQQWLQQIQPLGSEQQQQQQQQGSCASVSAGAVVPQLPSQLRNRRFCPGQPCEQQLQTPNLAQHLVLAQLLQKLSQQLPTVAAAATATQAAGLEASAAAAADAEMNTPVQHRLGLPATC
jgi:hypothetical protein